MSAPFAEVTNRVSRLPPPSGAKGVPSKGRQVLATTHTLQGYLMKMKRGGARLRITGNWNRRYFRLDPAKGTLVYFQSEKAALKAFDKPSGSIAVSHITAVSAFDDLSFNVVSDARTFFLKAATPVEKDTWVNRLRTCLSPVDVPESKEAEAKPAPVGKTVTVRPRPLLVETGMLSPQTVTTACSSASPHSGTFFTAKEEATPVPESRVESKVDTETPPGSASPNVPELSTCDPETPAGKVDDDAFNSSDEEEDLDYTALARGQFSFGGTPEAPKRTTAVIRGGADGVYKPRPVEKDLRVRVGRKSIKEDLNALAAPSLLSPSMKRSPPPAAAAAKAVESDADSDNWDESDCDADDATPGVSEVMQVAEVGAGVKTDENWVEEDWDEEE